MEKRPTDTLKSEHRVIERVLRSIAFLINRLEANEEVAVADISSLAEFMSSYGDKCHHGKEEKELFPLLVQRGIPAKGCPIAVLIHEHEVGRSLVRNLVEAAAKYANHEVDGKELLIKNLKGLIDLYPGHIWKEDFLLFPMTNEVLNSEDQEFLCKKFDAVDRSIGADELERLEKLARQLETTTKEG